MAHRHSPQSFFTRQDTRDHPHRYMPGEILQVIDEPVLSDEDGGYEAGGYDQDKDLAELDTFSRTYYADHHGSDNTPTRSARMSTDDRHHDLSQLADSIPMPRTPRQSVSRQVTPRQNESRPVTPRQNESRRMTPRNQSSPYDSVLPSRHQNELHRSAPPRNHTNSLHTPPTHRSQLTELTSAIQSQQLLLEKVLANQDQIAKDQADLSSRVKVIEDDISKIDTPKTTAATASRKRKFSRSLSNQITKLYEEMNPKFKLEESSLSRHNQQVKVDLLEQITASPLSSTDEDTVKIAIQRKYEGLRRTWLLQGKENSAETMDSIAKSKRYRARRQRKYDSRTSVIKENEKEKWEKLDQRYMTEESDDSDGGKKIVKHKLSWRSHRLNTWIEELDKRYTEKVKKDGGFMPRKLRETGSISKSQPPIDAPKWAIADLDEESAAH